MNARTMVAQARKLSDIAKFVFGEQRYVALDMDVVSSPWDEKPDVDYRVYISIPKSITPDGSVTFSSGQWKDVLAFITWLEGIEVPKPVRYLNR